MAGLSRRTVLKHPVRLTATTRAHSSGAISQTAWARPSCFGEMPALFTRMSKEPPSVLQPPAGGLQGRVVGHVRGDGSRSSASLADSGRYRLGVRPGHVQDAHSCAAPTEGLGDGRADPLTRPGDQNDPTR